MKSMRGLAGAWLLALLLLNPSREAAGQVPGEEKVREAAEVLRQAIAPEIPPGFQDRLAPSFREALRARQIDLGTVLRDHHKQYGGAEAVQLKKMTGPFAGEIELRFGKGIRIPVRVSLETEPPHRMIGLLIQLPVRENDSIEQVMADLKRLPGKVGFCMMELGESPRVVWQLEGERPLAVASSMKVVVLAALADAIARKERSWSDVVTVRKEWSSLPSGLVQDWPDQAPLTLHTLATLMISRSDNSAADHLLYLLGRERVEAMQVRLGVKKPELNEPFLATGEMFRIKLVLPEPEQQRYLDAATAGRRELLREIVKTATLARPRPPGRPLFIDQVEWFYSPGDLCRVMAMFQRQEEPAARAILGINRGVALDEQQWSYVGYKGGFEPGVVNFTWLLRNTRDRWFAFSITWNHAEGEVDQAALLSLAQRILRLAQELPAPRPDARGPTR